MRCVISATRPLLCICRRRNIARDATLSSPSKDTFSHRSRVPKIRSFQKLQRVTALLTPGLSGTKITCTCRCPCRQGWRCRVSAGEITGSVRLCGLARPRAGLVHRRPAEPQVPPGLDWTFRSPGMQWIGAWNAAQGEMGN
jgi:hypothetical protein